MTRKTVVIPATIAQAKKSLTGIDSLLTATEWERAAIVYAHTTDESKGGRPSSKPGEKSSSLLTISEFAALGIKGLLTRDTVRLYRNHWIAGGGKADIKPGDTVTLPTGKFPPGRTGTDGFDSGEGMEKTVTRMVEKHGAEAVAGAVAKTDAEAVGKVASETSAGVEGFIKGSKPKELSTDSKARLEETSEKIALSFMDSRAATTVKFLKTWVDDIGVWYAFAPDRATAFLNRVHELVTDIEVAKDGSVSDDDIAAFLLDATEGGRE
jgi:hypothetical protein